MTASGKTFPGTFENYTASVIAHWQASMNGDNLENLSQELKELGLTWKVIAKPVSDTQVEIQVARLPKTSKGNVSDMVSIADVGVGVSQTLPVLVALHAAKPGQLVYIEQPEIHLHPRAQTAMAQILANAAKRGVRVVVETHSSLLILGIQTLVAEGEISPELIKLHWFERRNGRTEITSRDLDETGAFGDWPEDFADVALEAQSRYLDAAESRMRSKRRAS
jgi:predicted ATPase